ncbi:phosphoglucosamine mutase, partial [Klebsiella pneumoniae]|nr:phosphoglucosamine mutase [Klebsiella pneumoniae]
CNMGLQTAFSRLGVPFARSGVGDKLVLDLMLQKGWRLGGEGSGHVIVLDKHNTGDGCIAALQALQAERVLGKKLKEIAAEWSRIPASQGSFR